MATNKYPGTCPTCKVGVPAYAGVLSKVGRKWITYCAAHGGTFRSTVERPCDCPRPGCQGCDWSYDAMKDGLFD